MSVIASDRRTLVVGLGKTGLSCVRYLCALGRDVAVADSRHNPPGLDTLRAGWPDVPVYLGDFDPALFARFNELVVSPGIAIAEPAIQAAAARGQRFVVISTCLPRPPMHQLSRLPAPTVKPR